MPQTPPELLARAKAMRRDMTQPERELWVALRAKRFAGTKFTRQVVIDRYIADFAARSARLIVEIDGHTHTDPARDAGRTARLEQLGYRVLRFTNINVMTNLEGVLITIAAALAACPSPNPLPGGERAIVAP